jgi:predicted esterase
VSLADKTPVTGSLVAMSVFKPDQLPPLSAAKGKPYYLLHSPTDFIPIKMAEKACDQLKAKGAVTKLAQYEGGHGWHGDVFGMIRRGVEWLEENTSGKP